MNAVDQALPSEQGRPCWIPLLESAAQEVFELMLDSHLTLAAKQPDPAGLNVTSMVSLTGELYGTMTVRCSDQSAGLMASKMLGVNVEKAACQMWDAVGEICNMVAGNFKNKVAGLGDGCLLSVPAVITGADYSLHLVAEAGSFQTTLLFEGAPVVFSLQVYR